MAAIEFELGRRRAVMRSCAPCETTTWEYNGKATPVANVLGVVSDNRKSFMRPKRAAA